MVRGRSGDSQGKFSDKIKYIALALVGLKTCRYYTAFSIDWGSKNNILKAEIYVFADP